MELSKKSLLTPEQRQHWLQQWAREADRLEERRRQLRAVAEPVAREIGAHWPQASLWQFGSSLGPGFHADSDLDLAVADLPAEALIRAFTLAQACAMRVVDQRGLAPVALDLVRLEALPSVWQERIQREGHRLR